MKKINLPLCTGLSLEYCGSAVSKKRNNLVKEIENEYACFIFHRNLNILINLYWKFQTILRERNNRYNKNFKNMKKYLILSSFWIYLQFFSFFENQHG